MVPLAVPGEAVRGTIFETWGAILGHGRDGTRGVREMSSTCAAGRELTKQMCSRARQDLRTFEHLAGQLA